MGAAPDSPAPQSAPTPASTPLFLLCVPSDVAANQWAGLAVRQARPGPDSAIGQPGLFLDRLPSHVQGDGADQRIAWGTGHPNPGVPLAQTLARLAESSATEARERVASAAGHGLLAHLDPGRGRLVLSTDRFGTRPVFIYRDARTTAVSDDLATLVTAAGKPPLRTQGLFDYFFFHNIPAPDTVFERITKLEPGTLLTVDRDGMKLERRWTPSFDAASAPFRIDEAGARLMQALTASVELDAADQKTRVGAFLSGGLDSSTVAGVLAQRAAGPVPDTFSIGFAAAEAYNELPYARVTARHFGTRQHEYEVTPGDVAEAIPVIASRYGEPFGNSSAVPTYFCAKLARAHGFDVLLAGDGGDELFAGNERYLKQLTLSRYARLGSLVRAAALVAGAVPGLPYRDKVLSLKDQISVPLPDRLQAYNFLVRMGSEAVFTPEFLTDIDVQAPFEKLRTRYREVIDQGSELGAMLYLDWKFTLADNDLPKVTQMCAANGVEVRFPLLQDPLVDFSLTVPDREMIKGGRLRHFYREGMQGFLARETLEKSKHGFGLPFGVWFREDPTLATMVADALGSLAGRRIFRQDFLDRTAALVRDEHAGYYGELAWILTILEHWFRHHRPDFSL